MGHPSGEFASFVFSPDTTYPLKITLVWTDVAGIGDPALVNDLNLKVTAPDATEYWGNYGLDTSHWSVSGGTADSLNNVENVFIENPMPGEWTIEVIAENIAMDGHIETFDIVDQDFALVATVSSPYICGDVDGSGGNPNVADLTYLVEYLFFDGPAPPVMEAANVDGEGGVNVADLIYLVDYLFFDGPEPICGPIE